MSTLLWVGYRIHNVNNISVNRVHVSTHPSAVRDGAGPIIQGHNAVLRGDILERKQYVQRICQNIV